MKSTKTSLLTKGKVQSVGKPALKRPKKCHLCNRMIGAEKYPEHYENCYRFKDKNPVRNASVAVKTTIKPTKQQNKQLDCQLNKKLSKSSIARNTGKNFRIKPSVRIQQSQMQKKQMKVIENTQEKPEEKKQIKSIENQSLSRQSEQQIIQNPIIRVYNPSISVDSENQISYLSENNRPNQQPIIINERNQPIIVLENPEQFFSTSRETNNISSTIHNRALNSLNQANSQAQNGTQTMEQLIANSNEIINFIQQLDDLSDDGSLEIMVSQLRQLNLVAAQVRDLDQVGMHLGYHLGQIFGNRIRQLQATIIHRVGFMLVRRFQQRIGAQAYIQLQNLFQRQPQIRVGFSKTEIGEFFPDKICLNTQQCPICLQNIEQGGTLKQLQCDHFFHSDCIQRWLQSSKQCPMCRKQQRA